jgi:hypothetical protein
MTKRIAALLLMGTLVLACGDEEEAPTPAAADNPPAEATEEAREGATAEEPPAAEAVDLEPPAEGETTTLLSLREGFAASSELWMGKTVTVTAMFMNATSIGGKVNNLSLIVNEEDYAEDRLAHSMMCAFGDDAPESIDLTQHSPITVRGTVIERFGRAGLEDCQIVE